MRLFEVLDSVVNKPFMFIQADRSLAEFDPNPTIYNRIIQHDFYDVAFWSRLKGLTGAGDISPKQCFRLTNRGILLFFGHYLKGKNRHEFHSNLNKLPGTEVKINLK